MSEQIQAQRHHTSSSEHARQQAAEYDEVAVQAAQEADLERIRQLRSSAAETLSHIDLLVA